VDFGRCSNDHHGMIFHTTDGGNTWTVQASIQNYCFNSVFFHRESKRMDCGCLQYPGVTGVIFRTSDGV